MTQVKLIHSHYDNAQLESVIVEMKELGAPTIKAVWMECHEMWIALDGCHRLRAADALGLTPVIEEVEYSDDNVDGCDCTVSELCDDMYTDFFAIEFDGLEGGEQ